MIGLTRVHIPNVHFDQLIRFTQLTVVTSRHTDRHRPRNVCSNMPHLQPSAAISYDGICCIGVIRLKR